MATKRTLLEDIDSLIQFQLEKKGIEPRRIHVKPDQFKTFMNKMYPGRKNKKTEEIVKNIISKGVFVYREVRIERYES